MPLPLLSLSSLASRVVLAQDLDTRELPLHLHRQVGDYKRLEGAFTLREVVFEVQRMDGGEVSKEEREEAWQFYLRNKMIATGPETEKMMGTKNKWSVAWGSGQISTTLCLENPVDIAELQIQILPLIENLEWLYIWGVVVVVCLYAIVRRSVGRSVGGFEDWRMGDLWGSWGYGRPS